MAGTIVHLAVATELVREFRANKEKLLGKYAKKFDAEDFFAGNICPDGIMAREGYQREMKLHTHFRDGIPDGTFHFPENIATFRKRLKQFFDSNAFSENKRFSLYLGYLTHMLTDELFVCEIYNEVLEAIALDGAPDMDEETFRRFGKDTDNIDFRLVGEYPGITESMQALRNVKPYEIDGMISQDELNRSREWIINYFFLTPHFIEEPKYLAYERVERFINETKETIVERLPYYLENK